MASRAQPVPPKPGVEMPQAYYDRVAQDPTAFQFQKAWIQKAERARQAREEYFSQHPGMQDLDMASLPDAVRDRIMTAGTVRVPVIAIDYANIAGPFTAATIENQLFNGPTTSDGTLTQLYAEMSYGAVNLTGDVYGWVSGTQNDTYYEGGCNGLCGAAKTGQLILEALNGVDAAVDFGQYDNDGPDGVPNSGDDDGFVDFIAIVHPEVGGECGTTNMWSHRWVVYGWPEFAGPWSSNDPRTGGGLIQVVDYTIQPARGSVTGCGAGINEIGVFAHEFGHAFGLPDLYDTNGGGQGIGEWGLMGSGNWQYPYNPAHMSAHSKIQLGWLSSQVVGPVSQTYNINYVENNQDAYQLNVMEEKFNRKTYTPIAGTASLHCGLPPVPAAARNWPGGAGYGNNWKERIYHDFNYNGAGSVTFEYDVSYDSEPTYDFGKLYIEVGGSETQIASYDGIGSANNVMIDLTPYLSGVTPYRLIAEFTSDLAWSDEDGSYLSGSGGPFKLDNISVSGGGESYFSDFEVCEDGWYYDFAANPPKEYFLVENRNTAGFFDSYLNGQGLAIWHIEDNVRSNTSGSSSTVNLRPAWVELECADGLNQLLLGVNRGDAGDPFPGSTNNTTFNNGTNPNSKSHNVFMTNVAVENIGPAGTTMQADMRGGFFPPTASSITPASGVANTVVSITDLAGTFIQYGAAFCLRSGGMTIATATNVEWLCKTKIIGDLDLAGVSPGLYDVVIKGPDGQEAVITDGFMVDAPVPVFIQAFAAESREDGVNLKWELFADEPIQGFRVMRGREGNVLSELANVSSPEARSYFDGDVERGTTYDYQLVVVLGDGNEVLSQRTSSKVQSYAADLEQNTPNPFNPTTQIAYSVPDGARAHVSLVIYDVTGAKVRTLVNESKGAGRFVATWDGRDDRGSLVRSGVYFYRLTQPGYVATKKMVLLK